MRYRILSPILALLLFVSSAQAQTADWQAVMDVAPGTVISVQAPHDVRCLFVRATDDTLSCEGTSYGPIPTDSHEMTFERRGIYRVRIELGPGNHALAGAVVGAGVGAAVGASGSYVGNHAKVALVFGLIGAGLGAECGRGLPSVRYRVIYKR